MRSALSRSLLRSATTSALLPWRHSKYIPQFHPAGRPAFSPPLRSFSMTEAVYTTQSLKEADAPTFRSLGVLPQPLLKALDGMGYEYMTPVQHQVLAACSSSTGDLLVQAKTGTGKTIAFLLPVLRDLLVAEPLEKGQVAILVMSPTRELAVQIAKECDQLTAQLRGSIECHTAFGGTARASSRNKFLKGDPKVLVATPGRLLDYLSEEDILARFSNLRTLVLDEADRMLDQGFMPAVKRILQFIPPKNHGWKGMCFSATLPPSIMGVVSNVLNRGYTHISTIDPNEAPTIAKVPQYVVKIDHIHDTFTMLYALLKQEAEQNPKNFKTIVFGVTANGVALMHALFEHLAPTILPGLKTFQLHSRLTQSVRTRTTAEFKAATSGLMFASDVIGRGMDFPNVGLVVQVGIPPDNEQYVHRVGRTGRAGNDGRAVTLLTAPEMFSINGLKELNEHINPYPVDLSSTAIAVAPAIQAAMNEVDETKKRRAYSAFLGFYKQYLKKLKTDPVGLVQMANLYSEVLQCPEPPMLSKRSVGMMGLKGVPGLRVGDVESENHPPTFRRGRGRVENQD